VGITGDYGLLPSSSTSTHTNTSWHGNYVVFPLVERAAHAVQAQMERDSTCVADTLFTKAQFREAFANCVGSTSSEAMSEGDVDILLRYLERDKKAVIISKDVSPGKRRRPTRSMTMFTYRLSNSYDPMMTPEPSQQWILAFSN
jgi:charged multivesicular body protein 7